MTVRELPPETVDRIAAGEVVTRPADVVRELVENALDASATSIEVTVENGGLDRIRVADDGHGMAREDALRAVGRHTTSKIRDAEDLRTAGTFGFRGEALPSIASVSRFALTTRAADADDDGGAAVRVVAENGIEDRHAEPAGRGVGTTVEVRNLFCNRPARRETLASPRTEFSRIADGVSGYALANPGVRVRLDHGERTVLSAPGSGSFTDAALAVYDRTVASRSTTIEHEGDDVGVRGLAVHPGVTRSSTDHVRVAVRGRPVEAPDLRAAVEDGYGSLLPDGRHPIAVVTVDVPPESVDQNVHPAKREVAFTDAERVRETVAAAVRDALSTADLARSAEVAFDLDASLAPVERESEFADARVIGQFRGLYLLCEADDDLLVVDQHAAHERVNYERLLETVEGGVPSAELDPPTTVTLSPAEASAVDEHRKALERAGFRVAPFGGRTYRVSAVPAPLGRSAAPESIHDALGALRDGSHDDPRADLLKDVACHPSLKAGDTLSDEDATRLVERLGQCDQPYACPHGRPTVLSLDEGTLARGFERGNTRL